MIDASPPAKACADPFILIRLMDNGVQHQSNINAHGVPLLIFMLESVKHAILSQGTTAQPPPTIVPGIGVTTPRVSKRHAQ